MIFTIDSKDNPKIKQAVKISDSAAYRRQTGSFFAASSKAVLDIIRAGFEPVWIFCTGESYEKFADKLPRDGVFIVSEAVRDKLSQGKTEDGIYGVFSMKKEENRDIFAAEKILVLEDIQDPGNMGAIMRTALAFGYKDVAVSEKCADIYSRKVIRSSMTASVKLNVVKVADTADFARRLNDRGFCTVAACLEGARELGSEKIEKPAALFIGNEGNGLSRQVIAACRKRVKIPMDSRIESLNAAVSAAVLMWEVAKQ